MVVMSDGTEISYYDPEGVVAEILKSPTDTEGWHYKSSE